MLAALVGNNIIGSYAWSRALCGMQALKISFILQTITKCEWNSILASSLHQSGTYVGACIHLSHCMLCINGHSSDVNPSRAALSHTALCPSIVQHTVLTQSFVDFLMDNGLSEISLFTTLVRVMFGVLRELCMNCINQQISIY